MTLCLHFYSNVVHREFLIHFILYVEWRLMSKYGCGYIIYNELYHCAIDGFKPIPPYKEVLHMHILYEILYNYPRKLGSFLTSTPHI